MSISGIGGATPFTTAGLLRLNTPEQAGPAGGPKSVREEFLDYARMTPAEKMRAALLAKLGVTEDQLKAMGADERKAIEAQLKKMIKDEVENDPDKRPGKLVDITA